MKSLVSVIVPVYNAKKYLQKCLDSIATQTWNNLQIICIDDASTDGSWEMLQDYAKKDSRFVVFTKINEKVSKARNMALTYALGEYVMFVDSDDWIDSDTVECALKAAQENDADVVMWSYIREMGNESRKKHIFDRDVVFSDIDVKNQLYRRMIGPYGEAVAEPDKMDALCPACMKLYRREIISRHHIEFFDIRKIGTYEDGMFNLHVFSHAKKAIYINKYFYHYRRDNSRSITSAYKPRLPEQWDILFGIMRKHIHNADLDSSFTKALENRIALSLIGLGLNEMENRASMCVKYMRIKILLHKPHYRSALKSLQLCRLPIHWKVFFLFAKMNWGFGVYLLLEIIQRMRGK